jgi:hypothetical protein
MCGAVGSQETIEPADDRSARPIMADVDEIDRDGVDSFPASDPPSHWSGDRRRLTTP